MQILQSANVAGFSANSAKSFIKSQFCSRS